MKAGIYLNGSGAILVVTSYDGLEESVLLRKLQTKGIEKFILYEVPVELVQQRYGQHFRAVMEDLKQEDDLRVMDFDGRRIFQKFSFREMGEPTYHEGLEL